MMTADAVCASQLTAPETVLRPCLTQIGGACAAAGLRRWVLVAPHLPDYAAAAGWTLLALPRSPTGLRDMYWRLAAGMEACADADRVYIVEHDMFYPQCHFLGPAPDGACHCNDAMVGLSEYGYFTRRSFTTATLCGPPLTIASECRYGESQTAAGIRLKWSEPWRLRNGFTANRWESAVPVIDLRWGGNITGTRRPKDGIYYSEIKGWPPARELLASVNITYQPEPPQC